MRDYLKFAFISVCVVSVVACGQSASKVNSVNVEVGAQTGTTPDAPAAKGGLDWPCFRGPQGTGVSLETGINKNWQAKQPRLLWKVALSDDGYAGPSVANGMVFIVDHSGAQDIVRAYNLNNGQQAWEYAYEDTDQNNYGYARSTPTVDNKRVYVLSRLGLLVCLDATNGKLIWSKNVVSDFGGQRPGWDLAGSPLIDGPNVVVCVGGQNAGMVALNKTNGATVWQGGGSAVPGYSTPVIAKINGVKQYVVMHAKGVMGVSAADGTLLWNGAWQTSYDVNAASPIVIGNSVFVTSGYEHGCALFGISGSSASILWQGKLMKSQFSTPILFNGYVYGTSDPGTLVCLDPKTGQAKWSQDGFEKGGCVAVDGTLITLNGSNGDVIMTELTPTGYKELGRLNAPLGGQSWTAPIFAQGKLIIRNKSALACIDLK